MESLLSSTPLMLLFRFLWFTLAWTRTVMLAITHVHENISLYKLHKGDPHHSVTVAEGWTAAGSEYE